MLEGRIPQVLAFVSFSAQEKLEDQSLTTSLPIKLYVPTLPGDDMTCSTPIEKVSIQLVF
jgi:hypothetical protein